MTDKSTRRERLQKLIQQYPELQSQDSLHEYYLECTDEEHCDSILVTFWKELLPTYQSRVTKSFKMNLGQVVKDLTLHQRVPVAIPAVINKYMSDQFVAVNQVEKYYERIKKEAEEEDEDEQAAQGGGLIYSIGSYFVDKVYQNTIGYYYAESQDAQCAFNENSLSEVNYINVQMLEKAGAGVQRWMEEKNVEIVELSALRKTIRSSLSKDQFEDVEENIDLILNHLQQTIRLAYGDISTAGSNLKIVKLSQIGQKLASSEISNEEKAPYLLKESLNHIDREISEKLAKITEMNQQIKQFSRTGDKTTALKLLRQRKNTDKFVDGLQDRKLSLEQMLMGIEEGVNNRLVFDTLKMANEATKQLNQGDQLDEDGNRTSLSSEMSNLLSEIETQSSQQNVINQKFGEVSASDAELLQELEDLPTDDPITEKSKEIDNSESDELLQQLKDLQIGSETVEVAHGFQQKQKVELIENYV